jgi:hypothetical protein
MRVAEELRYNLESANAPLSRQYCMNIRFPLGFAALVLLAFDGCPHGQRSFHKNGPSGPTKVLAVYEPWFGHPRHIDVGYSSQDPVNIKRQIQRAKSLHINGFVVDWYGDREPFIDKSYALVQSIAAQENFTVAMMYDETDKPAAEATDDALVAFDTFRDRYLADSAPGRQAYLMYQGRPVIFIFPKGGHTDWKRIRDEAETWNPKPLLIYEFRRVPTADVFDGFYAWVNPGKKGWAADGSNWGEDYLSDFYQTMRNKYPDKIVVGGAWPGFDDRHASWSLGRYMSSRCGDTFTDTLKMSQQFYPPDDPIPYLLIATWNDYEEGTAIERGTPRCGSSAKTTSP